jgi:hypothetical protein
MLFAVHEFTDHKPKRESSDAEIAHEGTVSFPSFEGTATHFRGAVAAREAGGKTKVRLNLEASLRG